MKKKIIIFSTLAIALVTVAIVCIFMFNKPKMNSTQWEDAITRFEEYESLTIKYSDSSNKYKILKRKNNYQYTNLSDDSVLYFKDNMYKYYYEGRWKRIEETDAYPVTLNYSMSTYKSLFKSFKYDKDNDLYYIENMMINDINYQRIEIKFENNDIRSYKLINANTISYEFSEYNNTKIAFPDDFDIVYKKLDNEEWLKIVEDTVNHNVYDYKSVFEKRYNGVLVESESNHGKCRKEEVYETLNQVNYKYVVNGDNWDFYQMDNSVYIYVNSFAREMVSFSQKTKIPYKLFLNAYKEFEFNEIANSYILKDYEFEDYYFDDVVVNIIDNKIGYISLKYRQTINDKEYNFVKVVEFTFNVNTNE